MAEATSEQDARQIEGATVRGWRVLIAGGGTGGHIYPGIAIAREFQQRDPEVEILFVGTARGLESKIVPREGFRLEMIDVAALKNVSVGAKFSSLRRLPLSFWVVRSLLRRFRPDVVIGVGGYSSGPVLLVAAALRLPTMVVEPNAMPGFTNRALSRFIRAAAVTFPEAQPFFRGKAVVTGNPIRSAFVNTPAKTRDGCLNVLVFGGSQGAHAINLAVIEALPQLSSAVAAGQIRFVHQTGEKDCSMVRDAYKQAGVAGDVRPFIDDMVTEFSRADLLLCRAGATTAAEMAAAGKAAIMIPLPFAADDHQRRNAEALARAGAAKMILQRDLTGARLADELKELAARPDLITAMETASRRLARADAAARTVDLALKISRK